MVEFEFIKNVKAEDVAWMISNANKETNGSLFASQELASVIVDNADKSDLLFDLFCTYAKGKFSIKAITEDCILSAEEIMLVIYADTTTCTEFDLVMETYINDAIHDTKNTDTSFMGQLAVYQPQNAFDIMCKIMQVEVDKKNEY